MTWRKTHISAEDVRQLHERFGIDLMTASILARRDVRTSEQVKYYLESELTYLRNPFLFDDMETFVDRIANAMEDGEKVRIFGDRDVDGITSTVLLKQELDRLGLEVSYKLPEGDEPYGLTVDGVDQANADGVTLIITVDCGISNYDEIVRARNLGIDTIIVDHHISGEMIPPAIAVIDPKADGSGYPFPHLAGCGVVAKCIWALRFSQTDFYREEFILLHAQPGNDTVVIQAVRLENLLEVDRVVEEVVPGVLPPSQSRLVEFLSCGLPILVLDADTETQQLRKAFGKNVDIHLADLRHDMEQVLPIIKDRSLFTLSTLSRAVKYSSSHGRDELDALVSLFTVYVLKKYPSLSSDYEKILDLVAIGTVADLMPMVDENRILVKKGLKVLMDGSRKSLLPLMSMQNLTGRVLGTTDLGWQISPIINASGRMGCPSVAVEMLLADDLHESEHLAGDLIRLNKERQKLGEDSWERLLPKAKNSLEEFGSKFLMVEDATLSRGITGVMAARLLKQFSVPSLVIARVDADRATGSMRSPAGFNVREFLSLFDDLFLDFGGHACAGGFSIDAKNVSELHDRMMEQIDCMDALDDGEETLRIDCTLPPDYFTPDIIRLVEFFEPYGEQNPPLQFLMEGAMLEDMQFLNNAKSGPTHLRLTFGFGKYKWPAVFWKAGDLAGKAFDTGDSVDVVFRLGRNYYKNHETLQLTVLDMKRHGSP
ncbi:MAG: single-stranded-DNA-specific exonuclease RecJ [Sphaerochaetaceae bacterium]|jgi:single-stranded-DNA-specific exonuclease